MGVSLDTPTLIEQGQRSRRQGQWEREVDRQQKVSSCPLARDLVLAMFVSGAGIQLFNIGWDVAMQEHIDESVLSRASSYDAVGSFVAMPVGQLIYGPLGDAFGYQEVLVVSGIVYAAVCGMTLTSRSVRNLGRVTTTEPAAAG